MKLTAVTRYTTNKEGQPLISAKTGRPYTSIRIKVEGNDKWISGFGSADNASWKEGDDVELVIEQKGEYLNFTTPKKTGGGMSEEQYQKMAFQITAIGIGIQEILEILKPKAKQPSYPENTAPVPFAEFDDMEQPF